MKNLAYTIAAILILVAILAVLVTSLTGHAVKEQGVIKIGMLAPLTGAGADWGTEVKEGIEFAFAENSNLIVDNKKLKLVIEDDKCDGKTAVNIMRKFIDVDNIKITGGTVCSSAALAIAPIDEENKVVHLSAGASNPALAHAGDYMFSLWPLDSYEMKEIADYASNKLDVDSAAILYLNNDYAVGLKDYFRKDFVANGGRVELVESFELEDTDFRTQLVKIKHSDVEAIFIGSNPKETPFILKQIKELGINKTILINGPAIESGSILEAAGNSADSVYYAIASMDPNVAFKARFHNEYGEEPTFLHALGYDCANLIIQGLKACSAEDSDCIRDYLYSVQNYKGASSTFSIDAKGHIIAPYNIKQIQNGKPVILN